MSNPSPDYNQGEIRKMLIENQRLLIENNQILHKMRKAAILSTVFRVVWFAVVLGVPVYAYFNYIQPNMDNLKEKWVEFEQVTSDTSAIKEWYESMSKGKTNQEGS